MSNGKLSPTSYVVLGLVALLGRATSYDMKNMVGMSIGYFWAFPHSQLYAEPARLVEIGMLREDREQGGRRRRIYSVTKEGRRVLTEWLGDPHTEQPEYRDTGLLKLFFSTMGTPEDVARLAETQLERNRARLEEYEGIQKRFDDVVGLELPLATLRLGIGVTRAALEFWEEIAEKAQSGTLAPGGITPPERID
jgi:PadR family transcriptional regulator AphA